ncbi:sodium:proton antiporter [Ehrlichia ruminantium]|uniref:Sodium:proton antiporter n=1 Tax=Ehrlichia ruminantium TaxID=779 RepID=A0AAE6Q8P6_EHRRU|nr:Na+/H+ antiporter subunit E [Ehrlichia ruminantium]QGR02260.1 sodium:proton antiporter [Ehrlichia ruminantium]QGR03182.1 sodium:proton antiporter [Ehrlichia ruminantium]QGR04107.1 sodium:proton antiporter [Ehrlichia ruminantium]
MRLFFILFVLWLALSGYFDLFFIGLGIASTIFAVFITKRLENAIPDDSSYTYRTKTRKLSCTPLYFIRYCFWIILQVALSNLHIIKKVWNFKTIIGPPIFRLVQTKQKSAISVSLLANSITLTPGTVSVNVSELNAPYEIRVLAIDEESMSGVTDIDNKVSQVFVDD